MTCFVLLPVSILFNESSEKQRVIYMRTVGHRSLLFFIILTSSVLMQGCAVWNFIDVRWQNATGYFNTYYNASRLFKEAEKEIAEHRFNRSINPQSAPVGAGFDPATLSAEESHIHIKRHVSMMDAGAPSTAIQKLDRVIEKCSRLLVHYPKSKWVDNALLLIGKSYYYKLEYLRAERKYHELLDGYPNSKLVTETILWLGKAYVRLEQWDVAEEMFERAVRDALKERKADIATMAYFEMGKMYLLMNRRADAITAFEQATQFESKRDLRIQVQLTLAREYERMGNAENAAQAYRDIFKLKPGLDLAFIAELNYAKLSRESGNLEEASNTLIEMLDNPMYLDHDAKIQLEIANLYQEYFKRYKDLDEELSSDAFHAAMDQYFFVDSTFRGHPEAAEALFAMGRIYEIELGDYDNAFENYNNAKLANPGSEAAQLGGKKAEVFGDYRKLRRRLFDVDTTLFFVRNPDTLRVRDSLQAIADSLERERKLTERGTESSMSEAERMAERFRRRRPHGRNTGRINPWQMEEEKAQVAASIGMLNTEQAVLATGPLYRRVNLSAIDPDSLQSELAILQMEMGWMMFDRIGNIDSAHYYYNLSLINKLPDTFRPQAVYTLAVIERRLGNDEEARNYEDRLVNNFPRSGYAADILRARGLEPPKDSTQIIQEAYDVAAALLERNNVTAGIAALRDFIERFPDSEQAIRATLAIAMALEETQGQEALAMYKDMVNKYPSSKYSQRGKEILAAIEKAERDKELQTQREIEMEQQRLAEEEERRRREQRLRNPLLDEELRVKRESVRATMEEEEVDPSRDDDFPLLPPGERTPKKEPEKAVPIEREPNIGPGSEMRLPGDVPRRVTPTTIDPE